MDMKEFIRNFKNNKMKKDQILIVFLIGVLLMVIAIPVKEKNDESEDENIYIEQFNENESTAYITYIEKQLERLLSEMEGAGEVSVMVTLQSSAEQVVEKDMEIQDDTVTESDSQGGTRVTGQSARKETTIYQQEETKPYVTKEIAPKVEGVVVIADGGDNPVVIKNMTESIQALFDIESHKIRIVKKGG